MPNIKLDLERAIAKAEREIGKGGGCLVIILALVGALGVIALRVAFGLFACIALAVITLGVAAGFGHHLPFFPIVGAWLILLFVLRRLRK